MVRPHPHQGFTDTGVLASQDRGRMGIVLGGLPKRLLHQAEDPHPAAAAGQSRALAPAPTFSEAIAAFTWLSASPRPLLALRLLLELRHHGGRRTGTWRRCPAVQRAAVLHRQPRQTLVEDGKVGGGGSGSRPSHRHRVDRARRAHAHALRGGSHHFTTTRRTMSVSDTMPASARPARTQSAPRRQACSRASGTLPRSSRRSSRRSRRHDRVVARGESYRLVGPQRLAHTQDERRPSSPFSTAGAATAAAAAATAFLEGTVQGSSCCSCWCCPSSAWLAASDSSSAPMSIAVEKIERPPPQPRISSITSTTPTADPFFFSHTGRDRNLCGRASSLAGPPLFASCWLIKTRKARTSTRRRPTTGRHR